MARFEAPGDKEWYFMMVWIFEKLEGFVWRKLLESQTALSGNIFHSNSLNFPKIQAV